MKKLVKTEQHAQEATQTMQMYESNGSKDIIITSW